MGVAETIQTASRPAPGRTLWPVGFVACAVSAHRNSSTPRWLAIPLPGKAIPVGYCLRPCPGSAGGHPGRVGHPGNADGSVSRRAGRSARPRGAANGLDARPASACPGLPTGPRSRAFEEIHRTVGAALGGHRQNTLRQSCMLGAPARRYRRRRSGSRLGRCCAANREADPRTRETRAIRPEYD